MDKHSIGDGLISPKFDPLCRLKNFQKITPKLLSYANYKQQQSARCTTTEINYYYYYYYVSGAFRYFGPKCNGHKIFLCIISFHYRSPDSQVVKTYKRLFPIFV